MHAEHRSGLDLRRLEQRVRARASGNCEYCGRVLGRHEGTLDFHQPLHRGGDATEANAVYAYSKCSAYKGGYWHETDPPRIPLLHPLHDPMGEHITRLGSGALVGRTAEGRFFVQRLRLNEQRPDTEPIEPLLRRIHQMYGHEQVWLFGSRARGQAGPRSDWDLLAVVPDDVPDADLEDGIIREMTDAADAAVDLFVVREGDFDAAKSVVNTLAHVVSSQGILLNDARPARRQPSPPRPGRPRRREEPRRG